MIVSLSYCASAFCAAACWAIFLFDPVPSPDHPADFDANRKFLGVVGPGGPDRYIAGHAEPVAL